MAQIGLAIAGRHPGYEIFTRINWFGPDPVDRDMRAASAAEAYVSAVLGAEYDTYELALCNFTSMVGRQEALRIILRTPHGYSILNRDNAPVSPTYILGEVRRMLVGNPLMTSGSTVRFMPGVVRPTFPDAQIAAFLGEFHLLQCWGGEITMVNASGHPYYVAANEQDMPQMVNALPHCERLTDASTVYFGQFHPSAQPAFIFYPEELDSKLKIKVLIKQHDGSVLSLPLTLPVTLHSENCGYDKNAYHDAAIDIDEAVVADTYRSGRLALATAGDVQAELRPETGEVAVTFTPRPKSRTFHVNIIGSDRQPLRDFNGLLTSLAGIEAPVSPAGYTFTGDDILRFEHNCQNPILLQTKFRIADGVNYAITGVSLMGDIITVNVRQLAPPAPAPAVPAQPVQGIAASAADESKLIVTIPSAWKPSSGTVSVEGYTTAGTVLSMTQHVNFVQTPDGTKQTATVSVPSNVRFEGYKAYFGVPPKYETTILMNPSERVFTADFCQSGKNGLFCRFADAFAYKYEDGIGGVWKFWRTALPAVAGFILIVVGMVIGVMRSDSLERAYERITSLIVGAHTPAPAAPADSVAFEAEPPADAAPVTKMIDGDDAEAPLSDEIPDAGSK